MIDVHCHLENEDYNKDRDDVIKECKKELKAVITSCANPKNYNLTMDLIRKYRNFVFGAFSIHPIYIKDMTKEEKEEYFNLIRDNKDHVVAIGETGLDYYWVKEEEWREKQRELFREMIRLAKELKKPLVIHARDSYEDCIEILENEGARRVDLHMFGGRKLLSRVIENQWFISMNAIILRSKNHKKIIRDMPLDRIMLETDSPWLAPDGGRNTPLTIKKVAEKIADIKKLDFEEVWRTCGRNAVKFFNLPIEL
ncbi:MAG: TatD family hydrolase [Candidatus Aenigmarchaeota archaeon]|nr:TatD family hydrolase [Candidatus Aenigmarchaeota archaeon]